MKPRCQGAKTPGHFTSFECRLDDNHDGFCEPYIAPTVDEWREMKRSAEAHKRAATMRADDCRAWSEENFSLRADLALYQAEAKTLRDKLESGDIEAPWRAEVIRLQAELDRARQSTADAMAGADGHLANLQAVCNGLRADLAKAEAERDAVVKQRAQEFEESNWVIERLRNERDRAVAISDNATRRVTAAEADAAVALGIGITAPGVVAVHREIDRLRRERDVAGACARAAEVDSALWQHCAMSQAAESAKLTAELDALRAIVESGEAAALDYSALFDDDEPRLQQDRPWSEYPIGTLVHAYNGGAWLRVAGGWLFNGHRPNPGGMFPSPGGDAVGACVELPAEGGTK